MRVEQGEEHRLDVGVLHRVPDGHELAGRPHEHGPIGHDVDVARVRLARIGERPDEPVERRRVGLLLRGLGLGRRRLWGSGLGGSGVASSKVGSGRTAGRVIDERRRFGGGGGGAAAGGSRRTGAGGFARAASRGGGPMRTWTALPRRRATTMRGLPARTIRTGALSALAAARSAEIGVPATSDSISTVESTPRVMGTYSPAIFTEGACPDSRRISAMSSLSR